MKIGIYGGTFDPPHMGHLEAARAAVEALDLDLVLLIPAAKPPHKALSPQSAPAGDRLAMAELMADGLNLMEGRPDCARADSLELEREGKSYTADTLAQLRERYPDDELWLLMGSDMFLTLDRWHAPERITALAGIAAFARREADRDGQMERQARRLREVYGARVRVIGQSRVIDISSTRLRAMLSHDRQAAGRLLWCQVYGCVLRRGLYGVEADLKELDVDALRACSYSMIRSKRMPHIRGCEEEAVRLARRWGADEGLARHAGILHDCTKYLDLAGQLKLCDEYGIVLDDLEKETVKLLHSKTGAAIARHVYGEPEAVYDAIFWHTTGRAGMSLLERVLYLADYIEPSRAEFEGLSEIRRLAYQDLDAALLLGCELTIADMERRGMPIHPCTRQARDWLKGRRS